ncbi:MAG: AAA family ATPase [Phycisphaerae bacterium]|nr:AAA family ATPase [Phycisphaerae bacterium]
MNHKGGVLKTTTTANLGAGLARLGKRVLVCDLDPQQNLTASLIGLRPFDGHVPTLFDAFMNEEGFDALIQPTATKGLDILPSAEDFFAAELSLAPKEAREFTLRTCFRRTECLSQYDFVLIDNSPSVSLITVNSLVASNYYLVPVSAEYLPLTGLIMLGNSIGRIQQKLAPELRLLGVVLTLYHRSENICREVERKLQAELGEMLCRTRIRVNTKAKTAPSVQKTIFQFEDDSAGRGTEDYTRLAEEMLVRVSSAHEAPMTEAANG